MATTDLKVMAKQKLEENKVFFNEAVAKIEELRFYAGRFGGNCDELILKQIDTYITELKQLRKTIDGKDSEAKTSVPAHPVTPAPKAL